MKTKILKLSSIVLLLLFIGAGCQKDEIEYADESIVVSNHPGVFVYKTKGDYFDKVWIQITPEGKLNQILSLDEKDIYNYEIDGKGQLNPKYRYLLRSGYIVGDAHINAVYTDITFTEYFKYTKENKTSCWPDELIWPRIIDKDPYEQLYWMGCLDCKIKEFTLLEVNEMIDAGTLETVFEKLK